MQLASCHPPALPDKVDKLACSGRSALHPHHRRHHLAAAQGRDYVEAGFGVSCRGLREFNFVDIALLS